MWNIKKGKWSQLPKNDGVIYPHGLAIDNEQGIDIDLFILFNSRESHPNVINLGQKRNPSTDFSASKDHLQTPKIIVN